MHVELRCPEDRQTGYASLPCNLASLQSLLISRGENVGTDELVLAPIILRDERTDVHTEATKRE